MIRSENRNQLTVPHITLTVFGLWAVNIILYFPSLQFGFINFDDYGVLLSHPQLYDENSFISSLKEIFISAFPREEPLLLRDVTWALDSYFFGFKNPFGYHLGNVVLNSLNAVLLWFFLYLTTRKVLFACIISLFFSVLPVHVEPVCWVMGRKDLLVTFFMLTGLILQTVSFNTADEKKTRTLYLLIIVITLLALLSKINALTYFMVLAAHQVFHPFLKGEHSPEAPINLKHCWKQIFPKFVPHLVISILIFLWYRRIISSWGVLDRGVDSFSIYHLKNLLLFMPIVFSLYLKLIFFPYDHSIYYHWPTIHQPLSSAEILFSILSALGVILFTVFLFKKRKDLLFYWTAFFFLMIPYLNIMYIGIWITNRYAYFFSFCILAAASAFFFQIGQSRYKYLKVLSGALLIGYISLNAFQTWHYQQVWRSDLELWKYEAELKSPSLMAMASLAGEYISIGKSRTEKKEQNAFYAEAERVTEKGLAIYKKSALRDTTPHLFRLYYYKGLLAQLRGAEYTQQLQLYEKAFHLKPEQPDVLRKMAEIHYRMALEAPDIEKQRILASKSLHYFSEYIDVIKNDPQRLRQNLLLLTKTYEANFYFLDSEINKVKNKLSGLINK